MDKEGARREVNNARSASETKTRKIYRHDFNPTTGRRTYAELSQIKAYAIAIVCPSEAGGSFCGCPPRAGGSAPAGNDIDRWKGWHGLWPCAGGSRQSAVPRGPPPASVRQRGCEASGGVVRQRSSERPHAPMRGRPRASVCPTPPQSRAMPLGDWEGGWTCVIAGRSSARALCSDQRCRYRCCCCCCCCAATRRASWSPVRVSGGPSECNE
jgi:hypothetical protein